MSDSMYCIINIGGKISKELIPKLFELIDDEFFEGLDIPRTVKEFLEANGTYFEFSGECTDYRNLLNFCVENKLDCIIKISPDTNVDRVIIFTQEGCSAKSYYSDPDGIPLFRKTDFKPLFKLLSDYAEHGIAALPLYINKEKNNEEVNEIIMDGLKDSEDFLKLFQNKIEKLFPSVPNIPPLIITDK